MYTCAFEGAIAANIHSCHEPANEVGRDASLRACADRLATSALHELQPCLQTRCLVHRVQERQREEIILALCRTSLTDHAGASVTGNRDELNRRVAERQTTWLVWLTWVIAALTVVLTVSTLALLVRGG
jgi:hypothetical protein